MKRPTYLTSVLLSVAQLTAVTSALAQGGDEADGEDEYELVDESGEVIEEEDDAGAEKAPPENAKAPEGKAAVWGIVRDTEFNEPVVDAEVEVLGQDKRVFTDADGRFRLEFAPGKYSLRVRYEGYQQQRIDGLDLAAGDVEHVRLKLSPDASATEVFEIVTEADQTRLSGLTLKRKRSASAGDSIGRAEISKTPDSNAAQASQRVPGATIEGGRFVYVRGLGNRYTNARLNGGLLPSPEPDQAAIPLDLFPALTLEYINIAKTFTPDMPGDFAGGSVEIVTRGVPEEFLFSASVSLGFNTATTFRSMLTHRGGGTDWLGIDDGLRALPGGLPDYALSRGVQRPDAEFVLDDELQLHGRELNSFMSSQRKTALPNHKFSMVVGDGWDLDDQGQKLGFIAAINYRRNFQIRDEQLAVFQPDTAADNGVKLIRDIEMESGLERVNWGAFGSVTYQPSNKHKLTLIGFRSQLSDKTTQSLEGYWDNIPATLHNTHLEFVSRALNVGQLVGEHEIDELNHGAFSWNAGYSVASRDQPNTRDVVYVSRPEQGGWFYLDGSESGRHFFADQGESALSGGLDYKQPLIPGEWDRNFLKVGGSIVIKRREFTARRFAFRGTRPRAADESVFSCPGQAYRADCPDSLFTPDNIGPNLTLDEGTQPTDAYEADLDVMSAYLMSDVDLTEQLRVVVGERVEHTRQDIVPVDQFESGAELEGADLKSFDLLPSASIIFSGTKKSKLRASVSRTLARPQLRELAPFAFSNYFAGRPTSGNPDLDITRITNLDLRFEYFPSLTDVLAFSIFYKGFTDPIETIVIPAGESGQIGYRNAEGANLIGTEVETRAGLKYLAPSLVDWGLVGNLTLIRSRIEVAQTGNNFLTNLSRPMVNQAPWVLNFAIDYDNSPFGLQSRLLLNVAGKRLVAVGTEGLDDTYQHPRPKLDLVAAKTLSDELSLKFSARNLTDSPLVETLGTDASRSDLRTRRYREGRTFTIGASLNL